MSKLRVVEAFGGIGAWAKALENLGIDHEVLDVIEFDESKMRGYNAIHGSNFVTSDITKVIPQDVPDHDVFCYSPPCTTYSAAGKNEGINSDTGQLFYHALPIISVKQPKYAIMENVKNLTQKKHRETFDAMLKSLEDAGYKNYWKVLNAKDYNVAQNRDRVFVVSIRNNIVQSFAFPDPVPLTQKLTDILESDAVLPILSNIYGGFGEKKPRTFYDYSPCIRTAKGGGHIPSVRTMSLQNIKQGACTEPAVLRPQRTAYGKAIRKQYEAGKIKESRHNMTELVPRTDGISNTITTVLKDNLVIIPGEQGYSIRNLSTLECLRLQSFSDEDHRKLVDAGMSSTQIYKMAGDAINVTVVEELFKALLCPQMPRCATQEVI